MSFRLGISCGEEFPHWVRFVKTHGAFVPPRRFPYFNCQTAKANRPLSLSGRGGSPVFPSLFRSPKRGEWRAERRIVRISPDGPEDQSGLWRIIRMRPRLPTRHSRYRPHSRTTAAGRCGTVVPRTVCSGGRSGTELRTPPASTASRPTQMTPHESAPRWTGPVEHTGNSRKGQENSRNVHIAQRRLHRRTCCRRHARFDSSSR